MAETLPAEVVEKMHAPPKPWDGCVRMRVPVCMCVCFLGWAGLGSRGWKGSCKALSSLLLLFHPPTPAHRPPRFSSSSSTDPHSTHTRSHSIPIITPDDLVAADGLIFGFPTRFGTPAAQMRAFWDSTGGLWAKGALVGKPVSFFFGTGTQVSAWCVFL